MDPTATPPTPMLRTVTLHGIEFQVADTHPQFWTEFTAGRWEPETLALFDHYIDRATVHVDVGAWIGPTVIYAARRARQVIGFEPDPVAFAALQQTVRANPRHADIAVHPVAIAARPGQLTMGACEQQGDSMSSSLFAGGAVSWTVPARRLEEFEAGWPAAAPVFLKIDIEGGEYGLVPALADFVRRRRPTISLSLHSHFFLGKSVSSSFVPKVLHEGRLFWRFLRCWPVFRQYPYIYTHRGCRLSRWRLLHRATWRRTPALILAHRPLPDGFPA